MKSKGVFQIAAIADMHCSPNTHGSLQQLFTKIQEKADVLLIGGDITSYGSPDEARIFVKELTAVISLPVLAVLGNHDYECDKQDEIKSILTSAGVKILDGSTCEIQGIGFAGVKGFGGGFGNRELQPWGEKAVKQFVDDAIGEALKLEAALARLQTTQKFALLHYAPIVETVRGEQLEIYPFLGSSRLEEVLNRYKVTAAFHGHAHAGQAEGRTSIGIPIYNVALPVLQRLYQSQTAFRLFSVNMSTENNSSKKQYEQTARSK